MTDQRRTSPNDDFFDRFEALTFDDVVVIPGYSETLPDEVDTSARFAADIELAVPAGVGRHGQGDRRPDGRRHGSPRWHRSDPPQHVDRGAGVGGPEGEAFAVGDDHRPRDARTDGPAARGGGPDAPLQVLRRTDHRSRRSPRRHPHQPRHPLLRRSRFRAARHRLHDLRRARHRRGRHLARPSQGDPPAAPHREASPGRRQRSSRRFDHREGHPEAARLPERLTRRARAAAVRRGCRRRRRSGGACRSARRDGCRCSVDRHRSRPFGQCRQGDPTHQGIVARSAGHGRQRGDRRRRRDPRRGRRRRRQGRRRGRFDLHHPRGVRGRNAAVVGDLVHGPASSSARHTGDRRRWHHLLRRHRQGDRRRRLHGDARLPARRHRGEPRRDGAVRGSPVQELPGHGFDGRDDRRQPGSIRHGSGIGRQDRGRRRQQQARPRRHRGARAVRRPARRRRRTSWSADCVPAWATPARRRSRRCVAPA